MTSVWYSEGMGYSVNCFPKALAALGHEVHMITSRAQIYYDSDRYKQVYENILGPNIVDQTTKVIDNFTFHRLGFLELKHFPFDRFISSRIYIPDVEKLLDRIAPDVIQSFTHDGPLSYQVALWAKKNNVPYFTESHMHASVMGKGLKSLLHKYIMRFVNLFNPQLRAINRITKKCICIADDVKNVMGTFYHVPSDLLLVQSLGVDLSVFFPIQSDVHVEERATLRSLCFLESHEIVCVYTGRLSLDKNPFLLAKAITLLRRQGFSVAAIFIGSGTQDAVREIEKEEGCKVLPFVPFEQLGKYYRACDIGVWPREESTSQLDAAACGLPLILSDQITVLERVDGNGLLYKEGHVDDLANQIRKLIPVSIRKTFSNNGALKIKQQFAWRTIALNRVEMFKKYLNK